MKTERSTAFVHPLLKKCMERIQSQVIVKHNAPFKVFETGRSHERHQELILKGKTLDIMSAHLYDLEEDPPRYATAVDYVYYKEKWSWNLRDSSVSAWYLLFGNLVLDICPELEWGGYNRKSTKFDHFQLTEYSIYNSLKETPCTIMK